MDAKPHCYWLLAACLLLPSAAATAQVYKWVDENGRVHYSDTKPPDAEKKAVEVLDESELEVKNTYESIDDGVNPDQLSRDRKRREEQRQSAEVKRLTEQANAFRNNNCYSRMEDVRRGNAGGGTRVVGTQEVKQCRVPIPAALQPYLSGYTYEGSSSQ